MSGSASNFNNDRYIVTTKCVYCKKIVLNSNKICFSCKDPCEYSDNTGYNTQTGGYKSRKNSINQDPFWCPEQLQLYDSGL